MNARHTPEGWHWQLDPLDPDGRVQVAKDGQVLCEVSSIKSAQFIIRALNNESALLSALKEMFRLYSDGRRFQYNSNREEYVAWCNDLDKAEDAASAALALAEPKEGK